MKTLMLNIVSAEAAIFSGEVRRVFASGAVGGLGVEPGHSPLLTALKPGEVSTVLANGEEKIFYVNGGLLEIQPFFVTVLADVAIRADHIDEAAALEAKERAEKTLSDQGSNIDFVRANVELAEALAQIRMIQRLKKQLK